MAALAAVMVIQLLANLVLTGYIVLFLAKRADKEAFSVSALAESAMAHIRSKSLDEKIAGDQARLAADVQLNYLRDTLAKQEKLEKDRVKVPQKVTADNGEKYNFDDIEIIS